MGLLLFSAQKRKQSPEGVDPQKGRKYLQAIHYTWANEQKRQFSEEVQVTNKYMKKCSTSLSIKEIKIKMTLRVYLTLFKMLINKKINKNKCWQGGGDSELLYVSQSRHC
jgi:hypothetical protein